MKVNLNNINMIQQALSDQNHMIDVSKEGFHAMMKLALTKNNNLTECDLINVSDNLNLDNLFLLNNLEFNDNELGIRESSEINIDIEENKEQGQKMYLENLIGLLGGCNFLNLNIISDKVSNNIDWHALTEKDVSENLNIFNTIRSLENVNQNNIIKQPDIKPDINIIPNKVKVSENITQEIPSHFNLNEEIVQKTEETKSNNSLIDEIIYDNKPILGRQLVEGDKAIVISDASSEIRSQALTQVKDKIVFMYEDGKINSPKEVIMELQPHNLGKVNIKMIFEDDKLKIEIKALNEDTQKILSDNKEGIVNALSKAIDSTISVDIKSQDMFYKNRPLYYYGSNVSSDYISEQKSENHNKHGRNENQNQDNRDEENSNFSELLNLKTIVNV